MSVSGAWRGIRCRPGRLVDATFLATLTESPGGQLGGMIEEEAEGGVLYATIEGHRRGEMLIFIATQDAAGSPQPPIQFIGEAGAGDASVKGTWIVATSEMGDRYGVFEMKKIAYGLGEAAAAAEFVPA